MGELCRPRSSRASCVRPSTTRRQRLRRSGTSGYCLHAVVCEPVNGRVGTPGHPAGSGRSGRRARRGTQRGVECTRSTECAGSAKPARTPRGTRRPARASEDAPAARPEWSAGAPRSAESGRSVACTRAERSRTRPPERARSPSSEQGFRRALWAGIPWALMPRVSRMRGSCPRHLVTSALPVRQRPDPLRTRRRRVPARRCLRAHAANAQGEDALFVCGADEHGVAITIGAEKEDEVVRRLRRAAGADVIKKHVRQARHRVRCLVGHERLARTTPSPERRTFFTPPRTSAATCCSQDTEDQLYCTHRPAFPRRPLRAPGRATFCQHERGARRRVPELRQVARGRCDFTDPRCQGVRERARAARDHATLVPRPAEAARRAHRGVDRALTNWKPNVRSLRSRTR